MTLIKDWVDFCWSVFKWGVVPGTILALLAALYLGPRVDEEIRCQVEQRFAEHYPNLEVTVRSAVRVEGRGIEIRDLSVRDPSVPGPHDVILHVEQAFLHCDAELVDLLGDVCVKHMTFRRPTLRLTRMPDGAWVGQKLWPPPKVSKSPPDATVESGTLEIVDLTKRPPSTMTFRDINLIAENQPRAEGDGPGLPARAMRGTLTGDHIGRIEIHGQGHPDRLDWQVGGTIHDLEISPELRRALPAPLSDQLTALRHLRGRAQLDFDARADAALGCAFKVTGRIQQGRIDDPRLPYPWTDVRGTLHADNRGLTVKNLFAEADRSTLWVDRGRYEFGCQVPNLLKAKVTQFTLDQRLRAFLPESLQEQWDKYLPEGAVNVSVDLVSDGRRIDMARSTATVDCLDVGFVFHKFPYPMYGGRGKLHVENDVLSIDMVATSDKRPVTIEGELRHPLSGPIGAFKARGQNMPIDAKVRAALLDEKTRRIFDQLAPRGYCDFEFECRRDDPAAKFDKHIFLNVRDGTICFANFPYPLQGIRGQIERFFDGRWEFRDLHGTNDTAHVTCNGRLVDDPRGKRLTVTLTAEAVRLDKDLHDALKPSMQRAWDNVDPSGMIDVTEATIDWLVEPKKLDIVVIARPRPDSVSMKPRVFPYRMDKLGGTLVYRDGAVTFDKFRAEHGRTQISGNGRWYFPPGGGWSFELKNLAAERLRLDDRDLLQALPARLRAGIAQLSPTGHMYLRDSRINIHHPAAPEAPMKADWDLHLGFQPGSIRCGLQLDNIRGELSMRGAFDGRTFESEGELDIESLMFKKLQFTEVKGPVWITDGQVRLGSYVARRQTKPNGTPLTAPRALTARLCGGTVKADAWVAPRHKPQYHVQAEVLGANLAQFAVETMPGRQDLKGRVGLTLSLEGVAPTINGLRGRGQLWLREGNIYELPLMIRLLQTLNPREPDASAFSEALVRFRIAGNHIYLEPISFEGDAFRLVGQGEMNFDTDIDLAFHASVGSNRWYVPLVTPIAGELSRQTMTIRARGTLQNPEISREVLPMAKQALRELDAKLRVSPPLSPLQPAAGQSAPRPGPLRR